MTPRAVMLARWARGWVGKPFAWGQVDCTTLALSWLDELTGWQSLWDLGIGRYGSSGEAAVWQQMLGFNLGQLLETAGGQPVPPKFAQPGDFLLSQIEGEPWQRVAICLGADALSADPERGVIRIPLAQLAPFEGVRVPCPRQS